MSTKVGQAEDDIYCACLSKSLCQISTPVTVGLYAPFGGRVYMLLDRITKCMRELASKITEKEVADLNQAPIKPVGWGFIRLLWMLLFYCPVITEKHLERKSIEFIFVNFSAWQYAGSDRLWAGLVTTLCDRIRKHFGAVTLSVFKVLGSVPKRDLESGGKEWKFKKSFCIKLVVILIVLLIGLLLLIVPVTFPGHGEGEGEKVTTVFGCLATLVSGSGIIMTLYKLGKSILISQKQKIERLVNSQKFSTQMGFMNEVKKEVELITQMVQSMEIFQKQKIRVVLQITSLELCAPDKVVGVLDAMNTLLSDRRAPFISILVVDPSIIVTCLENASTLKGMADNGYMFLNRTVTLPFSLPALGKKTKLQILKKAVQKTEDLIDWPCRNDAFRGTKTGIAETVKLLKEEMSDDEEPEVKTTHFQTVRCIQETFYALYSERDALHEYIPDSICHIKRIVNTIPVMVHLIMLSHIPWDNMSGKAVAAWVVLCNQWPCRLSWILQCLEDEEQSGSKEGFCDCCLWDVFKENSKELFSLKAGLKNLLDLDGDPEIFQKFLSRDFPFTVNNSRRLRLCTINLDSSIKHKMGLVRAINNLQNDWKDAEEKNNNVGMEEHESTSSSGNDEDLSKRGVGKENEDLRMDNFEGNRCLREVDREPDDCKEDAQIEEGLIVGMQKKQNVQSILENQKKEETVCIIENQHKEESEYIEDNQMREHLPGFTDVIENRVELIVYIDEIQKSENMSWSLEEVHKIEDVTGCIGKHEVSENLPVCIEKSQQRIYFLGDLEEIQNRENVPESVEEIQSREDMPKYIEKIQIRENLLSVTEKLQNKDFLECVEDIQKRADVPGFIKEIQTREDLSGLIKIQKIEDLPVCIEVNQNRDYLSGGTKEIQNRRFIGEIQKTEDQSGFIQIQKREDLPGYLEEIQNRDDSLMFIELQNRDVLPVFIALQKIEDLPCIEEIQKREESPCIEKMQNRGELPGCTENIQKQEDLPGCVEMFQNRQDVLECVEGIRKGEYVSGCIKKIQNKENLLEFIGDIQSRQDIKNREDLLRCVKEIQITERLLDCTDEMQNRKYLSGCIEKTQNSEDLLGYNGDPREDLIQCIQEIQNREHLTGCIEEIKNSEHLRECIDEIQRRQNLPGCTEEIQKIEDMPEFKEELQNRGDLDGSTEQSQKRKDLPVYIEEV